MANDWPYGLLWLAHTLPFVQGRAFGLTGNGKAGLGDEPSPYPTTYQPARVARDSHTLTRTAPLVPFESAVDVRVLTDNALLSAVEVSVDTESALLSAVEPRVPPDTLLLSAVEVDVLLTVLFEMTTDTVAESPADVALESVTDAAALPEMALESTVEVVTLFDTDLESATDVFVLLDSAFESVCEMRVITATAVESATDVASADVDTFDNALLTLVDLRNVAILVASARQTALQHRGPRTCRGALAICR